MAFVSVPKDLAVVKTKIAFNLTKRQLICFGTAAVIGVPVYIATRAVIGNQAAALLMIAVMLPFFFLGIYEKDGIPAEKLLRNYIRTRFVWKGIRLYKTENLYEQLLNKTGTEGKRNGTAKNQTAAKTPVGKRKTGKG